MLRCTCVRRYLARKSRLVRKRRVANGRSVDKEVFLLLFLFFKRDSAQLPTLEYCCFYFISIAIPKETYTFNGVCIALMYLCITYDNSWQKMSATFFVSYCLAQKQMRNVRVKHENRVMYGHDKSGKISFRDKTII